MKNKNLGEWHWFKGGILVSLLSVFTFFIFASIAGRNYPFGITAGFACIVVLPAAILFDSIIYLTNKYFNDSRKVF